MKSWTLPPGREFIFRPNITLFNKTKKRRSSFFASCIHIPVLLLKQTIHHTVANVFGEKTRKTNIFFYFCFFFVQDVA